MGLPVKASWKPRLLNKVLKNHLLGFNTLYHLYVFVILFYFIFHQQIKDFYDFIQTEYTTYFDISSWCESCSCKAPTSLSCVLRLRYFEINVFINFFANRTGFLFLLRHLVWILSRLRHPVRILSRLRHPVRILLPLRRTVRIMFL